MRHGIGRMRAGGGGFSPISLFAAGEQGAWYDPSDFSTMFQDSAAITPAAVGQPVSVILDKRLGKGVSTEIVSVAADRDFSSDTGFWTKDSGVTISGGVASWSSAISSIKLFRGSALTTGLMYEFTWTITSISAGGLQIFAGGNSGPARTTAGTYTERILCGATGTLAFISTANPTTAFVDNVSVKLVPGTHQVQTTAASRPTLQQDGSGNYYLNFDGVDDYMIATIGGAWLSLPFEEFVAVVCNNAGASVGNVFDSDTRVGLIGCDSATTYRAYSGTALNTARTVGETAVLSAIFNGASSSLQLNNVAASSGTTGATDPSTATSLFLGANFLASPSQLLQGRFYGGVITDRSCTAAERAAAKTYLGNRCGLSL
jgi:hypothetical protein